VEEWRSSGQRGSGGGRREEKRAVRGEKREGREG
jgi:hypothetical protein